MKRSPLQISVTRVEGRGAWGQEQELPRPRPRRIIRPWTAQMRMSQRWRTAPVARTGRASSRAVSRRASFLCVRVLLDPELAVPKLPLLPETIAELQKSDLHPSGAEAAPQSESDAAPAANAVRRHQRQRSTRRYQYLRARRDRAGSNPTGAYDPRGWFFPADVEHSEMNERDLAVDGAVEGAPGLGRDDTAPAAPREPSPRADAFDARIRDFDAFFEKTFDRTFQNWFGASHVHALAREYLDQISKGQKLLLNVAEENVVKRGQGDRLAALRRGVSPLEQVERAFAVVTAPTSCPALAEGEEGPREDFLNALVTHPAKTLGEILYTPASAADKAAVLSSATERGRNAGQLPGWATDMLRSTEADFRKLVWDFHGPALAEDLEDLVSLSLQVLETLLPVFGGTAYDPHRRQIDLLALAQTPVMRVRSPHAVVVADEVDPAVVERAFMKCAGSERDTPDVLLHGPEMSSPPAEVVARAEWRYIDVSHSVWDPLEAVATTLARLRKPAREVFLSHKPIETDIAFFEARLCAERIFRRIHTLFGEDETKTGEQDEAEAPDHSNSVPTNAAPGEAGETVAATGTTTGRGEELPVVHYKRIRSPYFYNWTIFTHLWHVVSRVGLWPAFHMFPVVKQRLLASRHLARALVVSLRPVLAVPRVEFQTRALLRAAAVGMTRTTTKTSYSTPALFVVLHNLVCGPNQFGTVVLALQIGFGTRYQHFWSSTGVFPLEAWLEGGIYPLKEETTLATITLPLTRWVQYQLTPPRPTEELAGKEGADENLPWADASTSHEWIRPLFETVRDAVLYLQKFLPHPSGGGGGAQHQDQQLPQPDGLLNDDRRSDAPSARHRGLLWAALHGVGKATSFRFVADDVLDYLFTSPAVRDLRRALVAGLRKAEYTVAAVFVQKLFGWDDEQQKVKEDVADDFQGAPPRPVGVLELPPSWFEDTVAYYERLWEVLAKKVTLQDLARDLPRLWSSVRKKFSLWTWHFHFREDEDEEDVEMNQREQMPGGNNPDRFQWWGFGSPENLVRSFAFEVTRMMTQFSPPTPVPVVPSENEDEDHDEPQTFGGTKLLFSSYPLRGIFRAAREQVRNHDFRTVRGVVKGLLRSSSPLPGTVIALTAALVVRGLLDADLHNVFRVGTTTSSSTTDQAELELLNRLDALRVRFVEQYEPWTKKWLVQAEAEMPELLSDVVPPAQLKRLAESFLRDRLVNPLVAENESKKVSRKNKSKSSGRTSDEEDLPVSSPTEFLEALEEKIVAIVRIGAEFLASCASHYEQALSKVWAHQSDPGADGRDRGGAASGAQATDRFDPATLDHDIALEEDFAEGLYALWPWAERSMGMLGGEQADRASRIRGEMEHNMGVELERLRRKLVPHLKPLATFVLCELNPWNESRSLSDPSLSIEFRRLLGRDVPTVGPFRVPVDEEVPARPDDEQQEEEQAPPPADVFGGLASQVRLADLAPEVMQTLEEMATVIEKDNLPRDLKPFFKKFVTQYFDRADEGLKLDLVFKYLEQAPRSSRQGERPPEVDPVSGKPSLARMLTAAGPFLQKSAQIFADKAETEETKALMRDHFRESLGRGNGMPWWELHRTLCGDTSSSEFCETSVPTPGGTSGGNAHQSPSGKAPAAEAGADADTPGPGDEEAHEQDHQDESGTELCRWRIAEATADDIARKRLHDYAYMDDLFRWERRDAFVLGDAGDHDGNSDDVDNQGTSHQHRYRSTPSSRLLREHDYPPDNHSGPPSNLVLAYFCHEGFHANSHRSWSRTLRREESYSSTKFLFEMDVEPHAVGTIAQGHVVRAYNTDREDWVATPSTEMVAAEKGYDSRGVKDLSAKSYWLRVQRPHLQSRLAAERKIVEGILTEAEAEEGSIVDKVTGSRAGVAFQFSRIEEELDVEQEVANLHRAHWFYNLRQTTVPPSGPDLDTRSCAGGTNMSPTTSSAAPGGLSAIRLVERVGEWALLTENAEGMITLQAWATEREPNLATGQGEVRAACTIGRNLNRFLDTWFHHALHEEKYSFFQADPHAGNLMVNRETGELKIVDFGYAFYEEYGGEGGAAGNDATAAQERAGAASRGENSSAPEAGTASGRSSGSGTDASGDAAAEDHKNALLSNFRDFVLAALFSDFNAFQTLFQVEEDDPLMEALRTHLPGLKERYFTGGTAPGRGGITATTNKEDGDGEAEEDLHHGATSATKEDGDEVDHGTKTDESTQTPGDLAQLVTSVAGEIVFAHLDRIQNPKLEGLRQFLAALGLLSDVFDLVKANKGDLFKRCAEIPLPTSAGAPAASSGSADRSSSASSGGFFSMRSARSSTNALEQVQDHEVGGVDNKNARTKELQEQEEIADIMDLRSFVLANPVKTFVWGVARTFGVQLKDNVLAGDLRKVTSVAGNIFNFAAEWVQGKLGGVAKKAIEQNMQFGAWSFSSVGT